MTVSVPFMPAAAWPGTVQRNLYVPGFSVAVTDLVPPVKTGVAATLLAAGALDREVVRYRGLVGEGERVRARLGAQLGGVELELPSGVGRDRDRLTAATATATAAAGSGAGRGAGRVVLLLLLLLPQATRAIPASASANRARSFFIGELPFKMACRLNVTRYEP